MFLSNDKENTVRDYNPSLKHFLVMYLVSTSAMNPVIYFTTLLLIPLLYLILSRGASKKLPPGSFGIPIIGHSLGFLRAMHTDTIEEWFQKRIRKYGPVSKLSLFGTPTVFLHGQAANKFVYTCDNNTLVPHQPPSFKMICGERNILELHGDEHKRVRGVLMSFLKPEVLRQYVGKMDEEIRKHLEIHWHGKHNIMVCKNFLIAKHIKKKKKKNDGVSPYMKYGFLFIFFFLFS